MAGLAETDTGVDTGEMLDFFLSGRCCVNALIELPHR